jgi:hypothetical protein
MVEKSCKVCKVLLNYKHKVKNSRNKKLSVSLHVKLDSGISYSVSSFQQIGDLFEMKDFDSLYEFFKT